MRKITCWSALTLLSVVNLTAGAQAQCSRHPTDGNKDLTAEISAATYSGARQVARSVHVSVTPIGPSSIAIGAPFALQMMSTADGFGGLYVLSASGRTQAWFENVRVRADEPIVYPQCGLTVRAAPPAGDETVIFVVSRERLAWLAGDGIAAPLDLQYTHAGLRAALRQNIGKLRRERWAIGEIQIRVHD